MDAGSRLRAGAVEWDKFERARIRYSIALQEQEQLRRRKFYAAR
jgi:hypothetical protein